MDMEMNEINNVQRYHHQCHPLLNQVILTKLFKILPPKDRRTFRIVCKLWHDISLSFWRSNTILKLQSMVRKLAGSQPENDIDLIILNQEMSLEGFLELFKDSGKTKPFRHLHLRHWKFLDQGNVGNPSLTLFWKLIGPSLKTLTLEATPVFGNVLEVIHQFCPHLEVLTLTLVVGREVGLFKSSSTLSGESEGPVRKFLSDMSIIKRDHPDKLQLLPFQVIINTNDPYRIGEEIADSQMSSMISLGILLQTLNVRYERGRELNFNEDQLKNLIILNGDTLKKIKIDVFSSRFNFANWDFPFGTKLCNLSELILINCEAFMKNLKFLKNSPGLRKLHIEVRAGPTGLPTNLVAATPKTEENNDMNDIKLWKLTELTFHYRMGVEDLKRVVEWFPNVEKVEIFLNNEQFAIVCENWGQVTNLFLKGDELTDEGIIGGNLNQVTRPNITWLKNLTSFVSESENLTDLSVFNGFLNLPKLLELDLYSLNISQDALIALKGRYIDAHVGDGDSEDLDDFEGTDDSDSDSDDSLPE